MGLFAEIRLRCDDKGYVGKTERKIGRDGIKQEPHPKSFLYFWDWLWYERGQGMEEYQATPVKEVKIENELKRTMGFFTALSTVMGTVIGAGVFFKAASVAEVTGSASLHMFSWFLGGMISVCAGLTGAELAAAIPETGGMIK